MGKTNARPDLEDSADMKSKIFITILAAIISVSVASSYVRSTSQNAQEAARRKSRYTLRQRAREAKEKGETKLELHGVISMREEFISFDDAATKFDLLKVELITGKSLINDEDDFITTWYKFRVLDTLSRAKTSYDFSSTKPPPEMLPIQEDEILIPVSGGTVTVDGVDVSWGEPGQPGVRVFDVSQKYLLFLRLDQASKIATIDLGSTGVFVVGDDDTFTPFNDKNRHIYNALRTNSVAGVREAMMGVYYIHRNLLGSL